MALTVKHLNGDASFMLTFDALLPGQPPYRILIDPWITGKSKIFHSKISVTKHKETPCISSLRELPEPDLVIISQNKSDHCNEVSLRQLPSRNTKTIILAEPAAARTIRSWNYFENDKVRAIPRWGDPKLTGQQMILRFKVESASPGQINPGQVTVAFIPQRKDISGLHAAIGITYRPPQVVETLSETADEPFTPPIPSRSWKSCSDLRLGSPVLSQPSESSTQATPGSSMPTTPSPTNSTLRSVRSVSTLATTLRDIGNSQAALASLRRPLSVIFSPHGIHYDSLHSYATSHLIAEAALPLTALLHCFDSVTNPWWLGGNILLGAPAGVQTAYTLGAQAWISAHDADKEVKGVATNFLRTQKWKEEDVLGALNDFELEWQKERQMLKHKMGYSSKKTAKPPVPLTDTLARPATAGNVRINPDLIRLGIGEEVMLTNAPIVVIDRESLNAKVQETPAMVNTGPDLKTTSGPVLRPPPRSPKRRPPPKPVDINAAVTAASVGLAATDNPSPSPPATAGYLSGDDEATMTTIPSLTTTTTATTVVSALDFFQQEIPSTFTERRYTTSIVSSQEQDQENTKTEKDSDLASLEAVMLMRHFEDEQHDD